MNPGAELAVLIGADRISDGDDDLHAHSVDWTPHALLRRRAGEQPVAPTCVVRPRSTEEVARVLAWANERRTAVVPFGAGSSVVSGITAADAIVVDMRAMNELLEIDEKSRLVRAQAGIMGPDLDNGLRRAGYFLGHEPQSFAISTLGGWLMTRASGQLSARYGGIEKLVVAVEFVLADGTVARTPVVPRRAAGPDLLALVVGSEGAFGIVTEATVRISPVPKGKEDRCVRFAHMNDAIASCRALAQSDLRPTLVRLYDADDSAIFLRHFPDEPQGPLLLLSFDGWRASERAEAALGLCGGEPGNDALVSHWWEHRNDAVQEFRTLIAGEGILGPHAAVDTMEVAASWSSLRAVYHAMKDALRERADLVGCHVSHVYPDGACLYFTLASVCSDDDAAVAAVASWWDAGMRTCLDNGGSISHHHGIGRLKAPWVHEELGPWHHVLAAVKKALDPNGIMNPGVLGL